MRSRFLLVLSWLIGIAPVMAQTTAPPIVPPPLPYVAPSYQAVLGGSAPLRVLVISKKSMLAWKGGGETRAISLVDNACLKTSAAGEQVGLARMTEDNSCALRQNGANFCAVPGTLRLESDKSVKVWSPNPDAWVSLPAPLIITPTADGYFSVAREIPLEEYLRNVVPGEMPSTFHPQALRAQAIIARTYALCKLGRHADEGADLCAAVHCQVYSDNAKRSKETDTAITSTRGLILLYGDKPAEPYYHSTCGGVTDDGGYVWGPAYDRPYLKPALDAVLKKPLEEATITDILAADDGYCKGSSNLRWNRQFSAAEVDALVSRNLAAVTGDKSVQIRKVTNMAVESRTPGGRAATLRVEGDGASVLVFGDQIRWLFGNGAPGADGLWSTLFDLTVTRDAAGAITSYTFRGAGRGHGLGLCQWGADGRAKAKQTFRDILQAYYPGTRLSEGVKGDRPLF